MVGHIGKQCHTPVVEGLASESSEFRCIVWLLVEGDSRVPLPELRKDASDRFGSEDGEDTLYGYVFEESIDERLKAWCKVVWCEGVRGCGGKDEDR